MATVFTNSGALMVTNYIVGDSLAPTNYYIAWGTGAGTANKSGTTLFTEASETRVSGTESKSAYDTAQWVGELTADGIKTITNVGLFDASIDGVMFVHKDFAGIALETGDKINFTITLQQT